MKVVAEGGGRGGGKADLRNTALVPVCGDFVRGSSWRVKCSARKWLRKGGRRGGSAPHLSNQAIQESFILHSESGCVRGGRGGTHLSNHAKE